MENIKVNSNIFVRFKNWINNLGFEHICFILAGLLVLFISVDLLSYPVKNSFFEDYSLSMQSNLLGQYEKEALSHNIRDFYYSSTQLSDSIYGDYKVLDLSEINENNKITRFPFDKKAIISIKILKRHKKSGLNNSIYLTDVEYVYQENNDKNHSSQYLDDYNYKIGHTHVIMTTKEIYYMENEYAHIIYSIYKNTLHVEYIQSLRDNDQLTDQKQQQAYQDFNLLNSNTKSSKK